MTREVISQPKICYDYTTNLQFTKKVEKYMYFQKLYILVSRPHEFAHAIILFYMKWLFSESEYITSEQCMETKRNGCEGDKTF